MNKIVLMMILCVSLQGCSNGAGSSKTDSLKSVAKSIDGEEPKEKEKNGLLAISEFMAVMALLKTQTE